MHAAKGGGSPAFELPGWTVPALLFAVICADAALIAQAIPRRHGDDDPGAEPMRATLAMALDRSIDDLRAEPDPRRAVIAAYRRMESTLAAAGLPRRASEAPREYLERVLAAAELPATPPATLTRLFEHAKFGTGGIEPPAREQAFAALVALRAQLRGMEG